MKKLRRSLLLTVLWVLAARDLHAQPLEPPVPLKTALSRAEAYVKKKKISTALLYLASVSRDTYESDPANNRWVIIWVPKDQNTFDGELRVHVYDNDRVAHSSSS